MRDHVPAEIAPLTTPPNDRRADAVVQIVGGGVAGLTVASALSDRGVAVVVRDRAPGIGASQCSWWAGGMLAPYCEEESAEPAVVALGTGAADWWDAHTGGVTRNGTLVVANGRDVTELRRFARRTRRHETVDAAAIGALEPDLAGRYHTGLFFREEAHLDPRETLHRLTSHLRERGVTLDYAAEATLGDGITVDCRGLSAADALTELRGVKGEMLLLRTREVALTRPIRLLHPRHPLYVVPRADGVFMIGATMIESDDRRRATARSVLEMLGAAYALHPAFAEAEILEIGVDARPAFPDNLPRVFWQGGRLHVNGLYRHGFLLAPAMAEQAADRILQTLEVSSCASS
ncbi:MAG: FAD-dependent oxidoreductase [Pseudomonadota bacterium]